MHYASPYINVNLCKEPRTACPRALQRNPKKLFNAIMQEGFLITSP